jgi:hypothetical protein
MRYLFLLLCCSSFLVGFSQTKFEDIKCDSFQVTLTDQQAIIYLKKKTGVYDLKIGDYLLKPTKNRIIYLQEIGTYIEVNLETITAYNFNGNKVYPYSATLSHPTNLSFIKINREDEKIILGDVLYELSLNNYGVNEWTEQIDLSGNAPSKIGNSSILPNSGYAGVRRLNDSLLIVTNFKHPSYELSEFSPLKSLVNPALDSLIIFDDYISLVYPPSVELNCYYSGIFNYVTNKWLVPPIYNRVWLNVFGFLIEHPTTSGYPYTYDFLTFDGTPIFQHLTAQNLENEPAFLKYLLPEISLQQSISYPERFKPSSGNNEMEPMMYVLDQDNNWSIAVPIYAHYQVNYELVSKPKEFVHYNPTYRIFFWLENDSIYAEVENKTYQVSQKQGQIDVYPKGMYYIDSAKIRLIEGKDTLLIDVLMDWGYPESGQLIPEVGIRIVNGNLILSNEDYHSTINPNDLEMWYNEMYDEMYGDNLTNYSNEASSIWQKQNGVWKKVSVDYSTIDKIPFGYLVSTGYFFEILNPQRVETKETLSRVLLLDENLKAISFYDYFDFEKAYIHDFGVEVWLENGCFLIGNDGKYITDELWSAFELEDGKIKAIRYKSFTDDDYWLYESELMIDEIKYFDYPVK